MELAIPVKRSLRGVTIGTGNKKLEELLAKASSLGKLEAYRPDPDEK